MIHLTYCYNEIDKMHCYSVTFENGNALFMQWVWFYLGALTKGDNQLLWPYVFTWAESKRIKSYKGVHSADQIAAFIYNAIRKHQRNLKS